ncbi:hypothetical protein VDGL01_04056 [Verticillium dahliae]
MCPARALKTGHRSRRAVKPPEVGGCGVAYGLTAPPSQYIATDEENELSTATPREPSCARSRWWAQRDPIDVESLISTAKYSPSTTPLSPVPPAPGAFRYDPAPQRRLGILGTHRRPVTHSVDCNMPSLAMHGYAAGNMAMMSTARRLLGIKPWGEPAA